MRYRPKRPIGRKTAKNAFFFTETFLAELQILFKLPLGQKIEKKIPSCCPFGPKFDFWPDSPGTAQIQFLFGFSASSPFIAI